MQIEGGSVATYWSQCVYRENKKLLGKPWLIYQ